MKYINSILIIFLSVLSTSSLAYDQFQKIDFEKKWFGKSYSIGEKETGIFGSIREFNQVKEARIQLRSATGLFRVNHSWSMILYAPKVSRSFPTLTPGLLLDTFSASSLFVTMRD